MRHDGGDGAKGAGVELAGRVRHFNPILGLTASASLGGLLMHSDDDFHELGMSGSLRWDPGRYGRGGRSFSPTGVGRAGEWEPAVQKRLTFPRSASVSLQTRAGG